MIGASPKLPLEGGLLSGLKIYGSRLRIFLEVIVYSACILALFVAFPIVAKSPQQRIWFLFAVAAVLATVHGFPSFIKRAVASTKARDPKTINALEVAQMVADATIAYEVVQEYLVDPRSREIERTQRFAIQFAKEFPDELFAEKQYSVYPAPDGAIMFVLKERLRHRDKIVTPWLIAVTQLREPLKDDLIRQLAIHVSPLGVRLRPEQIVVTRLSEQMDLFASSES